MKLILCEKCWDVVKLSMKPRTCECGQVAGKYLDNVTAVVTENAISLALGNGSLERAISDMRQLKKNSANNADREDYYEYGNGQISHAWVRPNEGSGNPHCKVATLEEILA